MGDSGQFRESPVAWHRPIRPRFVPEFGV
jgi:hypothetical protein